MPIRPMKGVALEKSNAHLLRFPCYASYKLDGIRGILEDGTSFSNSGRPLPSKEVQCFSLYLPDGLDGEWVYGDPAAEGCLELTKSAVMSQKWPAHLDKALLQFYAFDLVSNGTFEERINRYMQVPMRPWLHYLEQVLIQTQEQLDKFYYKAIQLGYEGIVVRSPQGRYKHGRATANEGSLWKMKPFGKELFEAKIIGWYAMRETVSGFTSNAFGLSERSYAADDKVEVEMLGGWHVRDTKTGIEFQIGGGRGMTHAKRIDWYKQGDDMIGDVIQYVCMQYGTVDKPRHPQYRTYRSRLDMTEY